MVDLLAVINASVAGVVSEALNQECIEEIYGGMNGVLGILKEDLIDLAEESQQNIRVPPLHSCFCTWNLSL